jgi:sugar/nucleoside kinase (ribokinase family)
MSVISHVVIAGHCTIDEIHTPDGRVLPATPGGAAAYATVGAVMAGARVTLITFLGDDYPFERFRAGLAGYGELDVSHVRWTAPRSIHNVVRYTASGFRTCEVESWTVMEELTPTAADLDEETVRGAHVLLTAGSLAKQYGAVRRLREIGRPVAVDTETHYFPTPGLKRALFAVAAAATYFLPSIEHLQQLYRCESRDVATYAARLLDLGCPWIIVKRGTEGSTLLDRANRRMWSVPPVRACEVADTTGAGDAFAGGFVAALAGGKDLLDATCWGTVSASFEVEAIGARLPESFGPDLANRRYVQVSGGVEEQVWRDRSKG